LPGDAAAFLRMLFKALGLATATTVGELLAPVIAATLTAQCLMSSDYSNEARLTGAAVGLGAGAVVGTAAYRALVARQAANLAARQAAVSVAKTAGQSAGASVLAKSVALSGKAIASGASSAPKLAAGAAAAGAIIIAGVVAASAVTVADHFWVTDAEREEELLRKDAFECDCAWTSDWVCPNSVLVRFPGYYSPGEAPDKIARDDGSWCFSYCCGVVEESMTAAMKVIKNRDELAVHVHDAKEQYLRQELAAPPRTFGSAAVAASVLGMGLVAWLILIAARHRRASALPLV